MKNFDRVAEFYDVLAKLVFGNTIREAQCYYLNRVQKGDEVLIMGGGTGWILEELFRIQPDCKVTYIDASKRMIALATQRLSKGDRRVSFVVGTQDDIPERRIFDIIITPFFLDVFTKESLARTIGILKYSMKNDGLWIHTDFRSSLWWHGWLTTLMYFFFSMTAGIEGSKLLDFDRFFERAGLKILKRHFFFHSFIESSLIKMER